MALALEANVPFARYAAVENLSELSSAVSDLGFPCVLRPLVAPSRLLEKKALILLSADELQHAMPEWPDGHRRLLVQRYLKAPRQNLYFVASDGKLVSCVQVMIRRTDRTDGTGLAVEGNTVPLDERLRGYCAALVAGLDYSGVGCAQFLVDPESDDVSFLEINPRLGANCAIVQSCGIDLPRSALAIAAGESLDRCDLTDTYPAGRRYAWLFGDLAGLQHEFRNRRIGILSAGRWLIRAIWSSLRADVHLTFSWRDPMPAVTLFGRRAGRLRHRLWPRREGPTTLNDNKRVGQRQAQRADAD